MSYIKILYQCQGCLAFYQNKKRAERCHKQSIARYDVKLIKRNYVRKPAKERGEK